MFDRTVVFRGNSVEHVPYEKTIVEKRAPTDDSIRIYEEIKNKAYKSILDTITINDNTFNIRATVFDEVSTFRRVCLLSFTLNGEELVGSVSENRCYEYERNRFIGLVLRKASEMIASMLGDILLTEQREKLL